MYQEILIMFCDFFKPTFERKYVYRYAHVGTLPHAAQSTIKLVCRLEGNLGRWDVCDMINLLMIPIRISLIKSCYTSHNLMSEPQ